MTKKKTEVEHLASSLSPAADTVVKIEPASAPGEEDDLAALMVSISPYLSLGPNVWWQEEGEYVIFHDGDAQPEFRPEGPRLRHI